MSVFDRPLDDYSRLLYTASPSPLLPSLRHFEHNWEALPDVDDDDESGEEGED